MPDQQRGALRLVHPASDREPVNRERGSRILAIAEQPDDDQPAARESVVDRVLRVLTAEQLAASPLAELTDPIPVAPVALVPTPAGR